MSPDLQDLLLDKGASRRAAVTPPPQPKAVEPAPAPKATDEVVEVFDDTAQQAEILRHKGVLGMKDPEADRRDCP